MQDPSSTNRRRWLVAAAATTALLPMREVLAQTRSAGGDWLAMVKAQHALVARTFDALLSNASDQGLYARRDSIARTLSFQLTAHSVAEENVLYPALAMGGMLADADKLYMDQAHAKVMNAQLQFASTPQRKEAEWLATAQALRTAVLEHATGDEEGRLYPRLHETLDARRNAMLTDAFEREFVAVKARTWATS